MKKRLFLIVFLFLSVLLTAQTSKKELTFDDILKWNKITKTKISKNGDFIIYQVEPWKGDPLVKISNKKGTELETIIGAEKPSISNNSKFAFFLIQPKKDEVRQLKLNKSKEEDFPVQKLGIYNLPEQKLRKIDRLQSYKVPEKWDGWIFYQTKPEVKKDTSLEVENKKEKIKEQSDKNGYTLYIENLESGEIIQFPFVKKYVIAENKEIISYISTGDNKGFKPGVYYYNLTSNTNTAILNHKGFYTQLCLSKNGNQLAFLADTTKAQKKCYALYSWTANGSLNELVNNENPSIPEGWEISKHGDVTFSDSNNRVFFGTAPVKLEKDTTKLDEEIPQLDIWHWNEPVLHTQQLNKKEKNLKKSYIAVYHFNKEKMVQLENEIFTGIDLGETGDLDKILTWSNLPYSVQFMWEGDPYHHDFYFVDIYTGKATKIKKDCRAKPRISPNEKYIYWYNATDTTWNTFNINTEKEYKVTNPGTVQCADEINDVPNLPDNYGMAGWIEGDNALLVYDRYDIWKIDPENKRKPLNVTKTGRQNKISYRYINFERNYDEKNKGIDITQALYLRGHDEVSREDSYYKLSLAKSSSFKKLMGGKYKLTYPDKAEFSDVIVYTKESFQQFPDLLITANDFKSSTKISNVNPQQEEFHWGTIELYSWTSLDGQKLEGLLVKPENFDPGKKYPLIVNFYEKSSQNLYSHMIPEAHRSTVDYHYYTSNGYVIFNPDVYYEEGYPGESAFNCVMPGVTSLIKEGFIDEKAIAAQGHSWGGYQVAYLATKTNLFAAIESGAPVVNMFSAYGGIRLWTGRNRSFQYEHTQSRIGKSMWESPLRYLENSPLFTADKITTPLLIMHNEDDGAVPFSQGVEFFIALRRMGKKAWLLNYNDADHWPTKVRDKYDFQIRMAQFFDHYLKGKPAPEWMIEGLPAVNKGLDLGY